MQSEQGCNMKCGHSDSHMSEVLNSEKETFSVGAARADLLSFDDVTLCTCHSIYIRMEGSLNRELGAEVSAS